MSTVVFVVVLVFIAAVLFGRHGRHRTFAIHAPRLGILNLKGQTAEQEVAADIEALGPVLGKPVPGSTWQPFCDVLFIYCDVAPDGQLNGFPGTLRDLIQKLQAPVVIVATENSADAYIASTKDPGHGRANLVMTLARRGDAFATLFVRLFSDMKQGVSMPVAWAKIAPQGPAKEHEALPSMIFACELGQMTFA
jgi:hypothetical protein